ncbi:unnamed protein product, partial [Didymodactylos carnosus]
FINTGIVVDVHGPFWPMAHPIKHPTPSFNLFSIIENNNNSKRNNNRNKNIKEYYICSSNSSTNQQQQHHQQTYDNQPAMLRYTDTLKHPILIYDMEKSHRNQVAKQNDNEQLCPPLIFESRFEGGNLRQVKRVGQFEYELVLRPDLYTRRHTQWYYFRIQNMIAKITYRFRIINLVKKNSLYNDGMQILLFSELGAKKEQQGWHRVGHHINYSEYKQRSYNPLLERDLNYFELDFQTVRIS